MVGLFSRKRGGQAADVPASGELGGSRPEVRIHATSVEETEPDSSFMKIIELARSREEIVDMSKGSEGIVVEPYGEYLLIFDGTRIRVVNQHGEQIPEFAKLGVTKLKELAGARVVKTKDSDEVKYKLPDSYSTEYCNPLMKYMVDGLFVYNEEGLPMSDESDGVSILRDRKDVYVTSVNGQLIIGDRKTKGVIYYDTEELNGEVKEPRNWTRNDPVSRLWGSLPESIKTRIDIMNQSATKLLVINPQIYCVANTDGIKFMGQRSNLPYDLANDSLAGIEKNVCQDNVNPNIVYYCTSNNPREIVQVDLDETSPKKDKIIIPANLVYPVVHNLAIDPTGTCFCFDTGVDTVFIDKTTMEEVGRIKQAANPIFDSEGNVRVVGSRGNIITYSADMSELRARIEAKQNAKLVENIDADDLFGSADGGSEGVTADRPELNGVVDKYRAIFTERLSKCSSWGDFAPVEDKLHQLKDHLVANSLSEEDADYVVGRVKGVITDKQRELASKSSENLIQSVEGRLAGETLTMTDIDKLREDLDSLQKMSPLLETQSRDQMVRLDGQLRNRVAETFSKEAESTRSELIKLIEGAKAELESMTTISTFDGWMDRKAVQIRSRLAFMLQNCPFEAIDVRRTITETSEKFEDLLEQYIDKFTLEYGQVREAASELLDQRVRTFQKMQDSYFERLGRKKFNDRKEAERYFTNDESYQQLQGEADVINSMDPGSGKIVQRNLKVRVANFLSEVDRGSLNEVSETGAQMVKFGEVDFPKWEGKTKQLSERKVELKFKRNPNSIGPGTKADEICGDICLEISDAHGNISSAELYEGTDREEDWKTGAVSVLGHRLPAPYVTQGDYAALRQDWREWQKPESKIKAELDNKFAEISEKFALRPRNADGTPAVGAPEHDIWYQEYQKLVNDYAEYRLKHHVSILRRLDDVQTEPDKEYVNGKGYVPGWKNHWVLDGETMYNLERMARLLQMQSETQQGMLNLVGHAGTGKDLLVLMFCHMANRPYFSTDCSKWTTESELSEDIILEAEDGASRTVKVPSAVLNAITTPGAVMYFNEFNAMPQTAQIFLHGLLDEKRSLSLKTSSGEIVQADPSVLLISSMNPGYPETFEPQFATKSRLSHIEIFPPELFREKDQDDPNANLPYNFSEPLRIARGVASLEDLTYDPDASQNGFVRLWDRYINGIDNGSPGPTPTQRFDLDVILALVNFSKMLRDAFISTYEKGGSPGSRTLKVSQPLTGREIRECTYFLSKMPEDQKVTADPEKVARTLLEESFLPKIYSHKERENIRIAMEGWTSAKRLV